MSQMPVIISEAFKEENNNTDQVVFIFCEYVKVNKKLIAN